MSVIKLHCTFRSLFGSKNCGAPATDNVGCYALCSEHANLIKRKKS